MKTPIQSLLVLFCISGLTYGTVASAADLTVRSVGVDGTPRHVTGTLGTIDLTNTAAVSRMAAEDISADTRFADSASRFLRSFARQHLAAGQREDFKITRSTVDALGKTHSRFNQTIDGVVVDGAELILHSDAASGNVYAVNGEFVRGTAKAQQAKLQWYPSLQQAFAGKRAEELEILENGTLRYLRLDDGQLKLTWRTPVSWIDRLGHHEAYVFVDAVNGGIVEIESLIHETRVRTRDAQKKKRKMGKFLCEDDEDCGHAIGQATHDNARMMVRYLDEALDRDSIDDKGKRIKVTVDYRNDKNEGYNNAFFSSFRNRIIFGDGDGVRFRELGLSFDIVAHELIHGVIKFEANLKYKDESGALNEAWADILATSAAAWRDGAITEETWMLGEDAFTPGIEGDALRYMNQPQLSPSQRDYYPGRYTGDGDNGGVHVNSGIANLAFFLIVEGGSHPRGVTDFAVDGIGMADAEQIFYRALTTYLSKKSNFEDARWATVQAAEDLFGAAEVESVHRAWCAVGVPGCPDDIVADPDGFTPTESDTSVDTSTDSTTTTTTQPVKELPKKIRPTKFER